MSVRWKTRTHSERRNRWRNSWPRRFKNHNFPFWRRTRTNERKRSEALMAALKNGIAVIVVDVGSNSSIGSHSAAWLEETPSGCMEP